MEIADKRKSVVEFLLNQNILLEAQHAEHLHDDNNVNALHDAIQNNTPWPAPFDTLQPKNDFEFGYDDSPTIDEKGVYRYNWPEVRYDLDYTPSVEVLWSYDEPPKKRSVQDFVQYFNARYKELERMLRSREELKGLTSIARLNSKQQKDTVALVGMVTEKQTTKNNNLIITIEDPTGSIRVIVTQRDPNVFDMAKDLVLDEVIGLTGMLGDGVVFGNGIIHPDIPLQAELKKSPVPGYAVFISDLQIGSNEFLGKQLIRFLHWIRGEVGTPEQRALAKQVGYLLIGGDLVDGVGIHPRQEDFLTINDIFAQFEQLAEFMKLVPKQIQIIICPGNHDPCRLAEPQPALTTDIGKPVADLENVTMVSNPAYINIHEQSNFPGFTILLYHGYSFDFYAANVDSIRQNGGYERADLIMKFLLQRRHLAPAHTSTLYIPDPKRDPLIIHKIPDFFLTGHIHYSAVAQYRAVTTINGSCWQGMTDLQEKLGHKPVWARANLINLQTRKVKVMNFDS